LNRFRERQEGDTVEFVVEKDDSKSSTAADETLKNSPVVFDCLTAAGRGNDDISIT